MALAYFALLAGAALIALGTVRDLPGAGGIRATIATGHDGPTRVLVLPHQYDEAPRMISWVLRAC